MLLMMRRVFYGEHTASDGIDAAKDTPNFKAIFGDRVPTIEEFIEYSVATLQLMYSRTN